MEQWMSRVNRYIFWIAIQIGWIAIQIIFPRCKQGIRLRFYHMMSWKWKMDQSNVSIQVTCQVVVDWQRPAKSNYDLLLSSTSKFKWMHYLIDVKLFWIYQMIYNCDEDEKIYIKIYSDWFKFIVVISHNRTPNNGSSFYFVLVTLFTMQTTTIMSL